MPLSFFAFLHQAGENPALALTALLALGVLVALAAAALLYVQNHLVYTDDGVRVNLPFGLSSGEESLPDPGNVSVVIGGGEEPEKEEEEVSPELPEPETLAALEVPLSTLLDGTAGQKLEQAGK